MAHIDDVINREGALGPRCGTIRIDARVLNTCDIAIGAYGFAIVSNRDSILCSAPIVITGIVNPRCTIPLDKRIGGSD